MKDPKKCGHVRPSFMVFGFKLDVSSLFKRVVNVHNNNNNFIP